MPKYELLQKYDLLQFADVARAVRSVMSIEMELEWPFATRVK